MKSEIEIKTERLREMLARENLGGVLLNAQHNFAWLTGGKSNAINLGSETGACFLLVRADGKRFVLANNIEMPRLLAEEISAGDFEPVEFRWQDEKASGNFIFEKARSLLSAAELVSDSALNPSIRSVEGSIARCRYELTGAEIERYRRLGKDAGEAIGNLFERLKPGETETEIARKVRDALAAYDIYPVVTLVGADARIENYRHPVPNAASVWKKVLLIAVCARRAGLIVNLSRLACIGKIPGELQRKTGATAYVFARLLSETKAGASGAELYEIAAAAYAEKGFAGEINRHHQGGATGYKTRDWVAHPAAKSEIVFKNQAFAWNPSVTGTKTEETCLVLPAGIETITQSANFPRIAVETGGREYFSPGILSL